jgi:hypothetical protein
MVVFSPSWIGRVDNPGKRIQFYAEFVLIDTWCESLNCRPTVLAYFVKRIAPPPPLIEVSNKFD